FRFLRDGPADIAGGETDPGGQNAVYGTFSEARRQSPDNAFADNVLNEAVGQGESPRDGEMAYDHSSEPECRERRRSAAIEGRDFPQHPQILDSDEQKIERGSGSHRGQHGDTPASARHDPVRLGIEA